MIAARTGGATRSHLRLAVALLGALIGALCVAPAPAPAAPPSWRTAGPQSAPASTPASATPAPAPARRAAPVTRTPARPPAAAVSAPHPGRRRPDPAAVRAAEAQAAEARALAAARPDVEFYVGAKLDSVLGQGDAFGRFDSAVGGGAEIGFELYGFELYGEALIMGNDQYFFTLQAGVDFDFGDPLRFSVGAFTGPMFFVFPRPQVETLELSPTQREALLASGFSESSLNSLVRAYDKAADDEADLDQFAVGYNLLRLRLALEYLAAPVALIGAHFTGSYHYLLSGEQVGADIKYRAIKDVERSRGLTPEQGQVLQEATGARPFDTQSVGGLNLQLGIYLRLVL